MESARDDLASSTVREKVVSGVVVLGLSLKSGSLG